MRLQPCVLLHARFDRLRGLSSGICRLNSLSHTGHTNEPACQRRVHQIRFHQGGSRAHDQVRHWPSGSAYRRCPPVDRTRALYRRYLHAGSGLRLRPAVATGPRRDRLHRPGGSPQRARRPGDIHGRRPGSGRHPEHTLQRAAGSEGRHSAGHCRPARPSPRAASAMSAIPSPSSSRKRSMPRATPAK